MDKIVNIEKFTDFNLLKNDVEEFRYQSKKLESENIALGQLVEILKDPVVTTFQDAKDKNSFVNV